MEKRLSLENSQRFQPSVRSGRMVSVVMLLALFLLLLGLAGPSRAADLLPAADRTPSPLVGEGRGGGNRPELTGLAIPFVENRGQQDPAVAFYAQTLAGTVYVTRTGQLVYALPHTDAGGWTLVEEAVGATPQVSAGPAAQTQVSYFHGNDPTQWRSGVSTVHSVELGEPWPGVRLAVQARGKQVEKLFALAPGVSVDAIQMQVKGAQGLTVADDGALHLTTERGEVRLTAPQAWQELAGERRVVEVAYRQLADDRYGFTLGEHDLHAPVVIDPLLQATYLGGTNHEDVWGALAIHPVSGEVYVSGQTYSTDFPGVAGGAQASSGNSNDAYVARLSADLTSLLQATYLGGTGDDAGFALAIHPVSGEVYVSGNTTSANFPGVAGGAQASSGGSSDAYVARLSADLKILNQATYLGGANAEHGNTLAIHPVSGKVYVSGDTNSANFPGVAGGAQASASSGWHAFVAWLSADLTSLLQATYLGGTNAEVCYALAIHPVSGEVYVSGQTYSTNFPGVAGGAQASSGGSSDAYVARLSADLKSLNQATYLGGTGSDEGDALAIHPVSGEVYVSGVTLSADFPGVTGGAQASSGGSRDTYVARLSTDLKSLNQATYLGGTGNDGGFALAIHPASGEVYVTGDTGSNNFPGVTGGAQAIGDGSDAYVARLSADLKSLNQATYLGGTGGDHGGALAIHPVSGEVYVSGNTSSADFPGVAGGAQASSGGFRDAYVARLTADLRANPPVVTPSAGANGSISPNTPQTVPYGQTTTFTVTPDASYSATVGGTCGGTLVGTTYTTNVITTDCTVDAAFTAITYTLTVNIAGTGAGTVSKFPEGGTYSSGTVVTLTANPAPGSTFAGWSGGSCTGTGTCIVTMNADQTVTATFVPSAAPVTLTAIALADPNPTAAASVRWTATFSQSIAGLTAANFALASGGGVTGAAITGVSGSGATWTVTAGTGTGTGTLGLNLANATGLTPAVTNAPFTGAVYTVNKSAPPVTGLAGIAWSGEQFVAVGPGGAIQTSPDGAAWTSQLSGITQDLYGVAWSGQRFVAVGAGGLILASADGQLWTTQPAGTALDLWGIAWSGGQFAVVGEGGVILTSPDGLTWTVRLTGTP